MDRPGLLEHAKHEVGDVGPGDEQAAAAELFRLDAGRNASIDQICAD